MSNRRSTDTTTAVPVLNEYKVKVYPNPFSDIMNIDFNNPVNGSKVSAEIYDLTGRLVYETELQQHACRT